MNNSYIYIIGSEEKPYKIGFSKTPEKRLKELQTGHPKKLLLYYVEEINESEIRYIEKCIHKELKFKKSHGEWFNIEIEESKSEILYAKMRYSKE